MEALIIFAGIIVGSFVGTLASFGFLWACQSLYWWHKGY